MRGRLLLVLSLLVVPAGVGSSLAGLDAHPSAGTGRLPSTAAGGGERAILSVSDEAHPHQVTTTLERSGVTVVDRFAFANALVVEAPIGLDALERMPGVVEAVPDEPLEGQLASSKPAIGLDERLQETSLSAESVGMAIVDSGVDADHPGLDDAVRAQYSVDDDGVHSGSEEPSLHGTHVAGILAGSGQGASADRGDVEGVAPDAGLISIDISEEFTTSNALRAFEWIYDNHETEEIDLVVNAWGRMRDPATYDSEDPIVRASDALVDDGVLVVFSAGNGGPTESKMTVEATNPNVLTVGAATDDGEVESYSSRGPVLEDGEPANWTKPDLVAPGSHVVATRPVDGEHRYEVMNGTSMAAPHVAAAAGLVWAKDPSLTPTQVQGLLERGARDVAESGVDETSGAGMVDVRASLAILDKTDGQTRRVSESTQHGAELTGPTQAGPVLSAASVEHEDAFEIEVPDNGTRLSAQLAWDGRSSLSVEIRGPSGSTVVEDTIESDEQLGVQDPRLGTWQVHVEPEGASRGSYQANVTVTWLESVDGDPLPVSRHRTTGGAFPATGDGFGPLGDQLVPGLSNGVAIAAGAVVTVATIVSKRVAASRSANPSPVERDA